jgi:hypothetical protein
MYGVLFSSICGWANNNSSIGHHGAPVFATPAAFGHDGSFGYVMNGSFLEQRVGEQHSAQHLMTKGKSSSQMRKK